MAYACIDPNWGEPVVMIDTIAETRFHARAAAEVSPACSLYSGAKLDCTPVIPGDWRRLAAQGYRIAKVSVTIDPAPASPADHHERTVR